MGEWTRNKRRGYPICMTFGLNMVILCFSSWRSEFRPVCNVRNQQHSSRNHLSYKLEVPKIFTGPLFFYDWGLALYHRIWLEHLKKTITSVIDKPRTTVPGSPYILTNRLIKLTHCDIIELEKGVYTTTTATTSTSHHHWVEMTFIFLNTRQRRMYIYLPRVYVSLSMRPILYSPQWLIQPLGVVVIGGGGSSTRVLVWIIVTDVRSLGSSGVQYVNQSECATVVFNLFQKNFKFHPQSDKIISQKLKSVPAKPSSYLPIHPYVV